MGCRRLTTLIASSVVRGSQQGESHGGVYLVDLQRRDIVQVLDWNTAAIDWRGRGWDRGLRGIACHGETTFIAASDELFAYDRDFRCLGSWRCAYLKHCHEIAVHRGNVFLAATGFDSILAFDIAEERFHWALHIDTDGLRFNGSIYDPQGDDGPLMLNKLHLNSVFCNEDGMYLAGLRTGGLLHYNGRQMHMSATLPRGTHNAQPYKDGVLFNDTVADVVRFASRDPSRDRAFRVPRFTREQLIGVDEYASKVARPSFGRGLCVLGDDLVAAGSSPSTIAVHDLKANATALKVTLSLDIRNAIHGLALWPF